jgi:hypothetical protein
MSSHHVTNPLITNSITVSLPVLKYASTIDPQSELSPAYSHFSVGSINPPFLNALSRTGHLRAGFRALLMSCVGPVNWNWQPSMLLENSLERQLTLVSRVFTFQTSIMVYTIAKYDVSGKER